MCQYSGRFLFLFREILFMEEAASLSFLSFLVWCIDAQYPWQRRSNSISVKYNTIRPDFWGLYHNKACRLCKMSTTTYLIDGSLATFPGILMTYQPFFFMA
ncbi:hypothetical protein EV127DRAFT_430647 [Xylaria flabelliformis]|nr:hypothetical protein EV127DRAFT_430647 [Xylaria flabelliformis]